MNHYRDCENFRLVLIILTSSFVIFSGCGEPMDANLVHVQGKVTLNGVPVPMGMVIFQPNSTKGNRGPQSHANIRNGIFDTRQSGKPVVLGPQRVLIYGGDGNDPDPDNPFGKTLIQEHLIHIDISRDSPALQFDLIGLNKWK
ncbi:MAG: hypothetical protein RMJ56_17180 [Gemmataceae bacterium]|nr:hypothetical protein [Gemmata sp.]MDW8199330.1 hypothetical protein [Gemmataceae bacterium]